MKEAFRLLNKSIIRVEQPDIHLEEEEENEQMEVEEGEPNMVTTSVAKSTLISCQHSVTQIDLFASICFPAMQRLSFSF